MAFGEMYGGGERERSMNCLVEGTGLFFWSEPSTTEGGETALSERERRKENEGRIEPSMNCLGVGADPSEPAPPEGGEMACEKTEDVAIEVKVQQDQER